MFFLFDISGQIPVIDHLPWSIVGVSHSVDQDLEALKSEFPVDYQVMEDHLQHAATEEVAGTLVQTRLDPRVREYKLPKGIRVLFVLNFETREVQVGYAGRHLNKRRTDQQIRKIGKKV